MSHRFVTDLRDGLDESGNEIGGNEELRRVFRALANYVGAALLRTPGERTPTVFRCIARRGRGRCKGRVQVMNLRAPGPVEWSCDACGTTGEIRGWQGTVFDLPSEFAPEAPGDEIRCIALQSEPVDELAASCDLRSPFRLLLLRSSPFLDKVALRLTAQQYDAIEVDPRTGRLRIESLPSLFAPNEALRVRSENVVDDTKRSAMKSDAAAVVASLFERIPSTPAELRTRLATVDKNLAREVLLRRVRQGDVPVDADDLWRAAYDEVRGENCAEELAEVVEGAKYAPRGRAIALGSLQMIDGRAASAAMSRLPQRDSARIFAEQLRSVLRSLDEEPELSRAFGDAINKGLGPGRLALLESIEAIRTEEGVPATLVYASVLASSASPEIATFAATRLAEAGRSGMETIEAELRKIRSPMIRSAVERVIESNRSHPSPPPPHSEGVAAVRGEAWISGCDGLGAAIVFFKIERPVGGHRLVNAVFRVTGEVRDSFVVPKLRSGELSAMMRTITDGGAPPFQKVSLGIAARFLRDAIERGTAEGRTVPVESTAAIARLESIVDEPLPELPKSIESPSDEATERMLARPEYRSWFFSPGDLAGAGIRGDGSTIESAVAAIAESSLRTRLIAMSEYMARWHTLRGDRDLAARSAANARLLRTAFMLASLPRVMLRKSPVDMSGAIEIRAPQFGDEDVRHMLRRRFFRDVDSPMGRDLARLDFAEVARAIVNDILPRLPAEEQPRDEETIPIAYEIGALFERGEASTAGRLLDAVTRILRSGSRLSETRAREVADIVIEGLSSFRSVVCQRCRVRCIDAPGAPMTAAFFSKRHPVALKGR